MSFIESIRTVLSKYAAFSGRARRSEYWWYTLAYGIVMTVLYSVLIVPGLTEYMAALTEAAANPTGTVPAAPGSLTTGYVIFSLVALALLLPTLGVTVRRLHDTNRSGYWVFLHLVVFVGQIVLIAFAAQAGTPGENRFGADPKAQESAPAAV